MGGRGERGTGERDEEEKEEGEVNEEEVERYGEDSDAAEEEVGINWGLGEEEELEGGQNGGGEEMEIGGGEYLQEKEDFRKEASGERGVGRENKEDSWGRGGDSR